VKSIKFTILLLILFVTQSYSQISNIWSTYYNVDTEDDAYYVCPTFDKGCIITGVANGYDMSVDLFLLKLDSNGEIQWTHTFGGDLTQERGFCVRQTKDSCFIVIGYIEKNYAYKIYLLKLNPFGDTLWSKTYGDGVGGSVIETHDKCYLLAADKDTLDGRYPTLIKTDSEGNVLWSKLYSIAEPVTYSVMEMSKGDFILGCSGYSLIENKNVEMFCTDESGNIKWQRYNEKFTRIESTIELSGGSIVGVGSISGYQGSKLRIVKTNSSGNTLSEREYGMGDYTYSEGTGIEILGSDKLLIAAKSSGYGDVISNYWAWLLEADFNGDTLFTKTINNTGTNTTAGEFNSLGKLDDNQYFTAGRFFDRTKDFNSDFWIMKFKVDTTINGIDFVTGAKVPESFVLKQNYPNPFNSTTIIEYSLPSAQFVSIKIFDLLGQELTTIVEGYQLAGNHKVNFNGKYMSSGIYIYKLQTNGFTNSKKIVLLK
jgi:hypothetical protein